MTENEAIKGLKNLFSENCLDLPCTDSLEVLQTALVALFEIQQYRAIGTVEDIQEVMALCKSLQETTCKYMDIGTVEEFKALKDINRIADNLSKMERIEFKALKEKSVAKKPYIQQIVKDFREHDCYECPNCDCFVGYVSEFQEEHYQDIYCPNCGQKLDWQ